jgi:hypothetical protein
MTFVLVFHQIGLTYLDLNFRAVTAFMDYQHITFMYVEAKTDSAYYDINMGFEITRYCMFYFSCGFIVGHIVLSLHTPIHDTEKHPAQNDDFAY